MAFLDQILGDTTKELEAARRRRSLRELKQAWREAPPLRSFYAALSREFGLIAEIKKRSPSGGEMRADNFEQAPAAYASSPVVRAVSVLTNSTHFGMNIEELLRIKQAVPQPILRKDFIIDEYQICEARAFGADAILLMANVLEPHALESLYASACEAGLDVLFEAHTEAEIRKIPKAAKIWGINSRNFKSADKWWGMQQPAEAASAPAAAAPDRTVELETFELIKHLPESAIKVAESGLAPNGISEVARLGYDAVLVGTSLLKSPHGVDQALREFEGACLTVSREREAS